MVNYRIYMVHRVANRTFFLQRCAWDVELWGLGFCSNTGKNFMLVGINNVLSGYKTEQYRPCEKNIYPVFFQNKQMLFLN